MFIYMLGAPFFYVLYLLLILFKAFPLCLFRHPSLWEGLGRLFALFFSIHSLAGGDGNHVVDVVNGAATREIVHRTGDTLQNRTDSDSIAETLHHLITYVAHLKVREHEHVGLAGNVGAGSLLGTYAGNECCIGLQLAVNLPSRRKA